MFFEEELRGAAALAATGMMISRMALCVNRVFEIFLDTPFGHALSGVRVQKVQRGRLTGLRPEGCGRLPAAGCVEGL